MAALGAALVGAGHHFGCRPEQFAPPNGRARRPALIAGALTILLALLLRGIRQPAMASPRPDQTCYGRVITIAVIARVRKCLSMW